MEKKADVAFEPDFDFAGPTVGISGRRKQKIVGFGSAFTEAAASTFAKMPLEKQEAFLQQLFGPDGVGFTVGRVHINSCDFSLDNYDFDGTPGDLDLKDFDDEVTHDKKWLLPLIVRAQEVLRSNGGGLSLLASPWSPPGWMKNNEKMDGSEKTCLRDGLRPTWAKYISKWIAAYKSQGVPIWAITVQNEPEYAAPWDACTWSMEEEADFLGENLGPTLAMDHPEVKIFAYDHNKDHAMEWAEAIYGHETAGKYAHGIALHWYSGDQFENVQAIHDKFPGAVIMGSEATFEKGAWSHGDGMMREGKWSFGEGYAHDIMGDIKAGASGWIDWNMLLDETGGPNHVNNLCDAAVVSDGVDFYLHPQLYYMGHFSKWVLPGSKYIDTYVQGSDTYSGDTRGYGTCSGEDGLQAASFMRPDSQVALVVLNCGDYDIEFKIKAGEQAARAAIPAHAIQTYLISSSGGVAALAAGPERQALAPQTGLPGVTPECADAEYFKTDEGTSFCPPGSKMVSVEECKSAGPLNDPFYDDADDDPAGCFTYLGLFYWNTANGVGREERALLCKKCREPDQAIWGLFADGQGPLGVAVVGRERLFAPAIIASIAGIGFCGLLSAVGRRRAVSASGDQRQPLSSRQGGLLSYAPLV